MVRRHQIKECDLAYRFINNLMNGTIQPHAPYIMALSEVKAKGLSIHRFINEVRDVISVRDKIIVKTLLEIWEMKYVHREKNYEATN